MEQTGYVLEKDSEYSQKILEDEEEVSISITQKGGKTLQHQVTATLWDSPEPPRSADLVFEELLFVSGIYSKGLLLRLGSGSRPRPFQQQNPAGAAVHEPQ